MMPGETHLRRAVAVVATIVAALAVGAVPAGAATFTQSDGIDVPEGMGNSNPYPSELTVSDQFGPITDVNVSINNPVHDDPNDLDIWLRSPEGTDVILLSDSCGGGGLEGGFTFDQDAPTQFSSGADCSGLVGRPNDTDPGGDDDTSLSLVAGIDLDALNGENPNGTWSLYVADDTDNGGETGNYIGSWSLDIQIGSSAIHIPGDPFPVETDVFTDDDTVITDLDVALDGLSHTRVRDVDMFLEGPGRQKVWLISDACPSAQWTDDDVVVDDEAPNAFPATIGESDQCSGPRYSATALESDSDNDFPSPAPSPPGATDTQLSAFDLTDPDGTWRLWIGDDSAGYEGFADGYRLQMTTRSAANVGFSVGAVTAGEGSTVTVDVVRDAGVGTLGRGSVVVATESGTATAGTDFTPISETITFEPGETVETISVPVAADGPFELEEGFSVALGQTEGDARVGTPAAVGVTIPADAVGPPDDLPTGNEDKPPPARFTAANSLRHPPTTRRCRRRGQTIRFQPHLPPGIAIVRNEVYVNGHKIEDNIGVSAIAPIVLTMTSGKRMRVRIRFHSQDGRVVTVRRTFRRCPRHRPR